MHFEHRNLHLSLTPLSAMPPCQPRGSIKAKFHRRNVTEFISINNHTALGMHITADTHLHGMQWSLCSSQDVDASDNSVHTHMATCQK